VGLGNFLDFFLRKIVKIINKILTKPQMGTRIHGNFDSHRYSRSVLPCCLW